MIQNINVIGWGKNFLFAFLSIVLLGSFLLLFSEGKEFQEAILGIYPLEWGNLTGWFLVSQFLRACKWLYFLHCLHISIPSKDSMRIYLAGYAFALTPGRMGELIQAYLMKKEFGTDFSKVASVIFAGRITGFFGVLIICLGMLMQIVFLDWIDYWLSGLFMLVVLILVVLFFRCKTIGKKSIIALAGIPKLRRQFFCAVYKMYLSIHSLLSIKRILITILLSMGYWFSEGVLFFSIVEALRISVNILLAVFILCSSSIIGALSMMPGSVGILEGGLVGFLMLFCGVEFTIASGAALLHRFFSLWLPMGIGCVMFGWSLQSIKWLGFEKD